MAHEPIIAPAAFPSEVKHDAPSAEQPAPTAEQQQVADNLFTDVNQAAAALLALNAGAVAVGMIIDNSRPDNLPQEVPPRLPPKKNETE
jgi:hypothetical protein